MSELRISARGLEFAYIERGPADGPLALFLHGFPDTPISFREMLQVVGDAGFHAVAPWMRGYAPTSLASDSSYHIGSLAADANSLHEALGGDERAVLIGHDWGASALYAAIAVAPQRWRRAVAMAVPPQAAMLEAMSTIGQLQRSWYMWLFNTPIGALAAGANDMALIDHLYSQWSPGLDQSASVDAVTAVKAALADPANLDAALSYYRSLFAPPPIDPDAAAAQAAMFERSTVPVLYLHGEDDGCIGVDAIGDPRGLLAEGSAYVRVPGAGHFLQVEQPAAVHRAALAFLAAS